MDTSQSSDNAVTEQSKQRWDRLKPVWRRVRSRATVDSRSLAAFRIVIGFTLLVDLIHRASYIELFYTDQGVYTLSTYASTYGQYDGLSIHAASGSLWFQQFMFLVAGLFAIAFILGYRTRLAGAISLVLLVSLHARNPAVLNGGDLLFRILLFVSLLSPLGERWSVDALRRGAAQSSVATIGTVVLLLQPIVVFTSNAILKHGGDHWYAGEGLKIALSNDVMTVYLGNILVEYASLLPVLNYIWVVLLAGSALFLLVPTGRLRAVVALAYMGAFAGMMMTMSVGIFPLALVASVTPFLTAPFWDALTRRVPSEWIDRLPTPAQLGPFGKPSIERRLLETVRGRDHERVASYIVSYAQSLVTMVGLLVLVWMLMFAADDATEFDVPSEVDYEYLYQQNWGLYAPDPAESYSWYVVEADLETETVIAEIEGISQRFDRPPDASQEYATFRHRKYLQSVRSSGEDEAGSIATRYAEWACEQVSTNRDSRVETVRLYRMYQPSPVDG
jgi:hypothetical protein